MTARQPTNDEKNKPANDARADEMKSPPNNQQRMDSSQAAATNNSKQLLFLTLLSNLGETLLLHVCLWRLKNK